MCRSMTPANMDSTCVLACCRCHANPTRGPAVGGAVEQVHIAKDRSPDGWGDGLSS